MHHCLYKMVLVANIKLVSIELVLKLIVIFLGQTIKIKQQTSQHMKDLGHKMFDSY